MAENNAMDGFQVKGIFAAEIFLPAAQRLSLTVVSVQLKTFRYTVLHDFNGHEVNGMH